MVRKSAKVIVCIAWIGAAAGPVTGAAGGLESLKTADDYVAAAIARNPGLAAATASAAAAAATPGRSGAFPDPMLGFGYYVESPETRVGPMEYTAALTQKLPFFGKRGLAKDVARSLAGMADADRLLVLSELVYAVRVSYYEYGRLWSVGAVLKEERGLLERMEAVARVKYAAGEAGQENVLKAQLQLSQIEDDLTRNRRDVETISARLVELVNLDPRSVLPPPEPAPREPLASRGDIDSDSLLHVPVDNRPEIQAVQFAEERAASSVALAKRNYFPDITLGISYVAVGRREIDIPDNGKDIWQVGAAVNIPLWFGSLGAGVEEAEAEQARARSQREWVELQVRADVRDVRSSHRCTFLR